jgi:hypothetical protein
MVEYVGQTISSNSKGAIMLIHSTLNRLAIAVLSAGVFFVALTAEQCAAQTTSPAETTLKVTVEPGEAGGTIEQTTTILVTIDAVEAATRKITLSAEDGSKATFTAGPAIRNFDQLKAGDKFTATLLEKLVVYVRSDKPDKSAAYAAAMARAPKGAKPGGIIAEHYELVASVTSIDTDKRIATLQFSDGKTRTVAVRPDVDLSRYKVGDSVVIEATTALALLSAKP